MAWLKTKKNTRRWAAVIFFPSIGFFSLLFDTIKHNYHMTCVEMNYLLAMRQMSLVDWQCKLNESRSSSNFEFDLPRVHVHVISLARSFERRRACVEALQIQNISYEIFSAVDGLDDGAFHEREIARYAGKKKRAALHRTSMMRRDELESARSHYDTASLPEEVRNDLHERLRFGCSMSHVRLWMRLLSTNLPFFVILEDDARVVPNFQRRIVDALRQLPKDWDLFYAFACDIRPGEYLRGNIRQFRGGACTLGYAISRKGAEHLLFDAAIGSELPVDKMMNVPVSRGRMLAFYADPFLVERVDNAHEQSTLAYL